MTKREGAAQPPVKRKKLVLDQVLAGAAHLFAQKGYAATTLQDVADALGMSRPAIYYYFSSKEEILDALVEGVSIASVNLVRLPASADGDAFAHALKADVHSLCLHIARNADIYRVLNASGGQLPQPAADRFRKGKARVLERLVQLIEGGTQAGAFRAVDSAMAASGILAMATWMGQAGIINVHFPAEALAQTMSEMALRSIADERAGKPRGVPALIEQIRQDLSLIQRLTDRQDAKAPAGAALRSKRPPRRPAS